MITNKGKRDCITVDGRISTEGEPVISREGNPRAVEGGGDALELTEHSTRHSEREK